MVLDRVPRITDLSRRLLFAPSRLAVAVLALLAPAASFAQAPTFNAFISTPKGGEPWFQPGAAAVGDFNGDGKLDAIVTDHSYNGVVRLMLGNGNGTFSQSDVNVSDAPTNPTPDMIKAADLNGDGRLDAVFVSGQGSLKPTVMINTGNVSGVPQFTVTHYAPVYSGLRSVTVGDLNGDGRPDFIVGNAYGSLYVYLNNGNGAFTAGQATNLVPNVGGSTGRGAIADLNGDGKADYAVTSNQAGATDIFFGNGNGTLQTPPVVIPNYAVGVAVADVNGDSKPDLLEVDGSQLLVYLNAGGGTFGLSGTTLLAGANSLTTADINGDGTLDAVVGKSSSNQIAVLLGDGSGAFGAPALFAVNNNPQDVSVGDFNGDAKLDVATVGYGDRTFGVLTNTTVFVAPLPTQTLTILGGSGDAGAIAENVEYYNPATGNWQPAYLTGSHPWGFVAGTDSWINYTSSSASDPGVSTDRLNPWWYLYRVRVTVPLNTQNPKMTFSVKADNWAKIAINGVSTGPAIEGTADQVNADAVFSQNLQPGENTITINVGDYGGLNGFNFRIDLSVQSEQPLEIVPATPPDTTPPVIALPADIVAEATDPAGAAVSFEVSASDLGVEVPVSCSAASGTFGIGSTPVDCSATDAAGNTATGSFTVTVQDTIAPVITSIPPNQTLEATSAAGAAADFAAGATDAVGVTALTYSSASGSTFPLGTTTVNVTAKDAAGNSTTESFTVTVLDTTAPTLIVPASQTIEATSAAGAVATFAATADDAVGVTSVTYSSASGSTFALGTTSVDVTAKDAAGNTSTGSFTITVRDTTAPALSSVTASSTTLWPPNHQMVAIALTASASDAVGVTGYLVSAQSNEPDNGLGDGDTANDIQISGSGTLTPAVSLRAERGGKGNGRIYTITMVAVDAAGNLSASQSVTVTVPKSQSGR
jgi:hypothetical protein